MIYNQLLVAAALTGSVAAVKLPFSGETGAMTISQHMVKAGLTSVVPSSNLQDVQLLAGRTSTLKGGNGLRGTGKGKGKGKEGKSKEGKGKEGKGKEGKGKGKGKEGKGKDDDSSNEMYVGVQYYEGNENCNSPALLAGFLTNTCLETVNGGSFMLSYEYQTGGTFSAVERFWTGSTCDGTPDDVFDVAAAFGSPTVGQCVSDEAGRALSLVEVDVETLSNGFGFAKYSQCEEEVPVEVNFYYSGKCFSDDPNYSIRVTTDDCSTTGFAPVSEYTTADCSGSSSDSNWVAFDCAPPVDNDVEGEDVLITDMSGECL